MHKTFDFKKYVEYKVYSVTTIKNGYGQHAGFTTKRETNAFRDEVIGQLHTGTYIVYGKIRVEEFMIFWLEDIMRPRITDDTYTTYNLWRLPMTERIIQWGMQKIRPASMLTVFFTKQDIRYAEKQGN
nr:hypothetical protein [Dorea formicigenerans]